MVGDAKFENLESRIEKLEANFGKSKPQKDRKPRKPSEYNEFIKKFFEKNKDASKSHKELFSEAAKEWTLKKQEK
jgi:hypothetical protein